MSALAGGREEVLRLSLPLPLSIVGPLLIAVCDCLEAQGWTAVSVATDGMDRVIATPPWHVLTAEPEPAAPKAMCDRAGCPQPMHDNHYHCGGCDDPEVTGMLGHNGGCSPEQMLLPEVTVAQGRVVRRMRADPAWAPFGKAAPLRTLDALARLGLTETGPTHDVLTRLGERVADRLEGRS